VLDVVVGAAVDAKERAAALEKQTHL